MVLFAATVCVVVWIIVTGAIAGLGAWILGVFTLLLSYLLLANFVNRIIITADDQFLRITTGPLPHWYPPVKLQSSELKQLYVRRRLDQTDRGTITKYELWAELPNGTQRMLLPRDDAEDLLFIEQQVERRLGITDRRMPGEVPF